MLRGPQASSTSRGKSEADVFKVPFLPARSTSRTIPDLGTEDADVFGSVTSLTGKGKGKEVVDKPGSSELEKANRTVSTL